MTRGAKTPVTINGVSYKSMADAARATGVKAPTIFKAVRAGRTNNVGDGSDRPCRIGGVNYRSRLEAGELLDVGQHYVIGYLAVCAAIGVEP